MQYKEMAISPTGKHCVKSVRPRIFTFPFFSYSNCITRLVQMWRITNQKNSGYWHILRSEINLFSNQCLPLFIKWADFSMTMTSVLKELNTFLHRNKWEYSYAWICLTHFWPMFSLYTPWKHHKNCWRFWKQKSNAILIN